MDLIAFKQYCINLPLDVLLQKYIIDTDSYFFQKIENGLDEFDFKKDISEKLNVHVRDIIIVGSGKLGFSLKPYISKSKKSFYNFYEFDFKWKRNNFNKKSDLDIAIISSDLFDRQFVNLYNESSFYRQEYVEEWGQRPAFAKYLLMGRLATRFLPSKFKLSDEIKDVQEKYQIKFGREINIEIYKSWYFFETYHTNNLTNINLNLISTS
jgi:hypothetical protein